MKVQIELKTCQDCPFFKEESVYTADSWERPHDWFCAKKNNKKIASYVDWNEEKDIPIPNWCPIAVKPKKAKKKGK